MSNVPKDLLGDRVILVVDDDLDVRDYITEILRLSNPQARVLEADNGKRALEILQVHKPDILLLDLAMPVMDGYAVLEYLQANPAWKDIPTLVLTGYGHPDTEIDVLLAGAADFLNKPVQGRELITRIYLMIRGIEQREALRRKQEEVERVLNRVQVALMEKLGAEETSRILAEALKSD